MQTRGCLGVRVWAEPIANAMATAQTPGGIRGTRNTCVEKLGMIAQPHVICSRFSCGVREVPVPFACLIHITNAMRTYICNICPGVLWFCVSCFCLPSSVLAQQQPCGHRFVCLAFAWCVQAARAATPTRTCVCNLSFVFVAFENES